MSLQTRLSALITAIGADIKALQARTPTVLSRVTSFSESSEPTKAIEWWTSAGGALIAKLVTVNPIENSVIVNRSDVRLRVKSRDGTSVAEKLLLDSDGKSDFGFVVGTVNISWPGGSPFSNNVTKQAGLPGNRQPVHVDIQDRQIDGVASGVIGMADLYASDGTFRARAWANVNVSGTYTLTYVAW